MSCRGGFISSLIAHLFHTSSALCSQSSAEPQRAPAAAGAQGASHPVCAQESVPSSAGILFLLSPATPSRGGCACCKWGCPRACFCLPVPHSKHPEALGTEAWQQGWLCPCWRSFLEFMLFVSNSLTVRGLSALHSLREKKKKESKPSLNSGQCLQSLKPWKTQTILLLPQNHSHLAVPWPKGGDKSVSASCGDGDLLIWHRKRLSEESPDLGRAGLLPHKSCFPPWLSHSPL